LTVDLAVCSQVVSAPPQSRRCTRRLCRAVTSPPKTLGKSAAAEAAKRAARGPRPRCRPRSIDPGPVSRRSPSIRVLPLSHDRLILPTPTPLGECTLLISKHHGFGPLGAATIYSTSIPADFANRSSFFLRAGEVFFEFFDPGFRGASHPVPARPRFRIREPKSGGPPRRLRALSRRAAPAPSGLRPRLPTGPRLGQGLMLDPIAALSASDADYLQIASLPG